VARNRAVRAGRNRRQAPEQKDSGRSREILGILGLGAAIFLGAALVSLQIGDGRLMGPFGRSFSLLSYALFGVTSYAVALALGLVALRLFLDRQPLLRIGHGVGAALGIAAAATLAHLIGNSYRIDGYGPGGLFGETIAEVLRAVVSTAGTALLAVVALVVAVTLATPIRLREVIARALGQVRTAALWLTQQVRRGLAEAVRFAGEVIRAILPERDRDEYVADLEEEEEDEHGATERDDLGDPAFVTVSAPTPVRIVSAISEPVPAVAEGESDATERMDASALREILDAGGEGGEGGGRRKRRATLPGVGDAATADGGHAAGDGGPLIVESRFKHVDVAEMRVRERELDAQRNGYIPLGGGEYKLPPVNLLDYDEVQASNIDRGAMLELSARLVQTLENYGVKGEVTAIRPGPVVTMFEFAPAAGTRLSKIEGLSDELAMVLEALRVRIVAPIPGKAVVGIEVPNLARETVYLKEIVADDGFQKSKMKLPLALGKNIDGAPVVVDLAKMPHLLVAGTTGSGKSVAINSMIASLLYSATPEDVRLVMVDPKMLELAVYNDIPHLLLPVVTDPKHANLALRWAVDEMERRYQLLSEMRVRDIASFNKKVARLGAQHEADELRRQADAAERRAKTDDGEHPDEGQLELDLDAPPQRLPYIVVVIDEFADLMMCAPKEVETSVARIAQRARAAGIHLILATQRPSTNVITGLIKANFPSRIAFHVASKVDSRVILDTGGAEALLGAGDMLFTDRGAAPRRLHGCFVGSEEVDRVVSCLKEQGRPVYDLDILKPREGEDDEEFDDDEPADEKYDLAIRIVAETRRATVSYLQRRLGVGYNKAAKMIERMERDGIVSPPDHKKVREVLVPPAA
jgi:DNA segregation ATPase FtsK/SpoIIIE, S-DNA-T family